MSGEVLGGVIVVVGLNFASDTWSSSSRVTGDISVGVGANDQVIEMARQPVMMLYLVWWKNSLQTFATKADWGITSLLSSGKSQRGYIKCPRVTSQKLRPVASPTSCLPE